MNHHALARELKERIAERLECRHAWRLAQMVNGDLARRCRNCGRLESLHRRSGEWREVKGGW